MLLQKSGAKVLYLHSERFVADMVKALQHNAISEFKRFYRTVDALLIDDIQFFAGKERSQEEFFHTFNTLLEIQSQVIWTDGQIRECYYSTQRSLYVLAHHGHIQLKAGKHLQIQW